MNCMEFPPQLCKEVPLAVVIPFLPGPSARSWSLLRTCNVGQRWLHLCSGNCTLHMLYRTVSYMPQADLDKGWLRRKARVGRGKAGPWKVGELPLMGG